MPKVTERTIGDVYEVLQKLLEVTMIQIVQDQNEEDDAEVVMSFDGSGSALPMPYSQQFIGNLNPWTLSMGSLNPYSQMMPFLNPMFNPSAMLQAIPQPSNPFSYGTFPQTIRGANSYSSYPMSPSMPTYPSMSLEAQATFGIDELRDNFLETRQQQRERKRVQKLEEKLMKMS